MPLPLPQSYIGSMCELKTLENDLLAVGRIIKIDYDALEIAALNHGENLRLFQYRLPIKMFVHNEKEGDQVLVGITFLSTKLFARFEEVKPLQSFERRGAFRVNTGVEGRLYPLLDPEERAEFDQKLDEAELAEQESILEQFYTKVRVVDISLKGVRLATPGPLHRGERWCLDCTPLAQPMTFPLYVERAIKMPDESIQFGCSFIDITEKQSDLLVRDLFQLQRLEKIRRQNAAY